MNLFKKLLNKKSRIDLDNNGKIESYREEIQGVFSQFKKMNDQLDNVNEKLTTVINDEILLQEFEEDNLERIIAEANEKLEKSNKVVNIAKQEIEANSKLKEKVKDFIL